MTRLDEITSTERLLDIIRRKEESAGEDFEVPAPASSLKGSVLGVKGSRLARFRYWQGKAVVGVEIGQEALYLLKTKGAAGKKRIEDYRAIPYPDGIRQGAPEFPDFLRMSLAAFCATPGAVDLWVSIPEANVEMRRILIPKVGRRELAGVVFWSARKELDFDETSQILDYQIEGEVYDQGIAKLAVLIYAAPRGEVEETRNIFSKAGWPPAGVTIASFAVQNLFRAGLADPAAGQVASICIGNDFSRIDVYNRGSLVLTRNIRSGFLSLIEAVIEGYAEKSQSVSPKKTEAGEINGSISIEEAKRLLAGPTSPGGSAGERAGGLPRKLTSEELLDMIRPAVDRIVWQVQRTFEHLTQTSSEDRILSTYLISGANLSGQIFSYIEGQLGMKVEALDPFGHLDEASVPEDGERSSFVLALGLALSGGAYTPNLIYTYKDKAEAEAVIRINRLVFIAFISLVALCTLFYLYLGQAAAKKRETLSRLENELSRYPQSMDEKFFMNQLAELKKSNDRALNYGDRHLVLGLISELTQLTPADIRLVKVKIVAKEPPARGAKQQPAAGGDVQADKGGKEGTVVLEGMVKGDPQNQERELAEYLLKLNSSPLFGGANLRKTMRGELKGGEALEFQILMNIK